MDNIAKQAMKTIPAEGSAYTDAIEEYGILDNVASDAMDKLASCQIIEQNSSKWIMNNISLFF